MGMIPLDAAHGDAAVWILNVKPSAIDTYADLSNGRYADMRTQGTEQAVPAQASGVCAFPVDEVFAPSYDAGAVQRAKDTGAGLVTIQFNW